MSAGAPAGHARHDYQPGALRETARGANLGWPVLSWCALGRDRYRGALKRGALSCGIYLEEPLRLDRPTVLFIHGGAGVPSRFSALVGALRHRANCAAFLWDDTARLAPTAERLRATLLRAPTAMLVVAHSMGMLLPAFVGATDPRNLLRRLGAVYLNPLIGGSRYAGDFRALRWLRLGPLLQRALCRPSILDLAPESEFQRTICGPESRASSFAARTALLFTERPGKEPDIRPAHVPHYFGRTREELVRRFGTLQPAPRVHTNGHNAPLIEAHLVLPLIESLLERYGD